MDLGLQGKVALVTGGSQGIGKATVLALAAEGCHVVAAARTARTLEEVCAQARAHGVEALPVPVDVSERSAVEDLVARSVGWRDRLDVLVTSAAVKVPPRGADDDDELQRIEGKLMPTIWASRAAARHMTVAGRGSIVNLGGTSARGPFSVFNGDAMLLNGRSSLPQGLGNAAVANFVKHFSDEVAPHGVRVNGVHPGIVTSERHEERVRHIAEQQELSREAVVNLYNSRSPMGRLVTPGEVASVIAFLCSPLAGGVTGQAVGVDGGMSRVVAY